MNAEAIASFKPGLLSGVRKLANNLGQTQSQAQNQNSRTPTTSAEEHESDGKVKTRLMSMWNNMKYGKCDCHNFFMNVLKLLQWYRFLLYLGFKDGP